ncbi:MAG: T9SS type A sorting domain-containing protein [Bacteroidia bacterium]|nr:T9SS type A sorting domain-containing protein [Bacteroidia bacterium]
MKSIDLKIKILSLLFIHLSVLVYSQSDLDNHKKYWFYKSRLNNDFIKIGHTPTNSLFDVGHGESMPFNERNWDETTVGVINASDPQKNQRVLRHGDETARLGIYLAVLATEYKLLKNNGQDLTTVKHEIFCALNAINRLDYWAEPNLDQSKNPNLNGFFVRNDIPSHFVKDNYKHFNYYSHVVSLTDSTQDKGFTSSIVSNPVTRIDGNSADPGYLESPSEMSQDQVYYLLLGLTLTNKLVDVNDVDGNNVFAYENIGENKLAQEASNISERMIKYLKDHSNWKIENPNTGSQITGLGGNAQAYAYALDNLGCYIKYNQDLPFWYIPFITGIGAYPHNSCNDFRNTFSFSPLASAPWQAIAQFGGGPSADQQGFFNALAGTSNSAFVSKTLLNLNTQSAIQAIQNQINNLTNAANQQIQNILSNLPNNIPQWLQNVVNVTITAIQNTLQFIVSGLYAAITTLNQYLTPSVLTNSTDNRLLYNSTGAQVAYYNPCLFGTTNTPDGPPQLHLGSDEYFGIYVRDILHGYNFALPNWLQYIGNSLLAPAHLATYLDVTQALNNAPCEGNHNFNPISIPSGHQWGASNFMDRPDVLWKKTTCPGNLGDFAGTDYMLLHNLFYLTEGTNKPVVDYITRKPTTNYPNGNAFTLSNKQTFGAFENIKANNTVFANAGAEYRAGKEIALLPATTGNGGFSAVQGSDFNAIILPYQCSGISNNMNKSGTNPSDDFDTENSNKVTPPFTRTVQQKNEDNELNSFMNELQNTVNNQMDSLTNELNKLNAVVKNYSKFEIYPNPNTGKFVAEFNLTNEDNVTFTITDLLGHLVLAEKYVTGAFKLPVDLSELAKGVYMAKIKFTDGKTETKKITIQ